MVRREILCRAVTKAASGKPRQVVSRANGKAKQAHDPKKLAPDLIQDLIRGVYRFSDKIMRKQRVRSMACPRAASSRRDDRYLRFPDAAEFVLQPIAIADDLCFLECGKEVACGCCDVVLSESCAK